MRAVKRWRYYCEYCKKSGGSKYHMAAHEQNCTMNPNRHCGMCQHIDDEPFPKLADMISIVKSSVETGESELGGEYYSFAEGETEQSVLKKLKEMTSCPACILSALRQSGFVFMFDSFDYKKEKDAFWEPINADKNDEFMSMIGPVY